MHKLTLLLALPLLAACGMKGDLYETAPPPPAPVEAPAPAPADADPIADPTADTPGDDTSKGDRKTIPATPDPAQSQ